MSIHMFCHKRSNLHQASVFTTLYSYRRPTLSLPDTRQQKKIKVRFTVQSTKHQNLSRFLVTSCTADLHPVPLKSMKYQEEFKSPVRSRHFISWLLSCWGMLSPSKTIIKLSLGFWPLRLVIQLVDALQVVVYNWLYITHIKKLERGKMWQNPLTK